MKRSNFDAQMGGFDSTPTPEEPFNFKLFLEATIHRQNSTLLELGCQPSQPPSSPIPQRPMPPPPPGVPKGLVPLLQYNLRRQNSILSEFARQRSHDNKIREAVPQKPIPQAPKAPKKPTPPALRVICSQPSCFMGEVFYLKDEHGRYIEDLAQFDDPVDDTVDASGDDLAASTSGATLEISGCCGGASSVVPLPVDPRFPIYALDDNAFFSDSESDDEAHDCQGGDNTIFDKVPRLESPKDAIVGKTANILYAGEWNFWESMDLKAILEDSTVPPAPPPPQLPLQPYLPPVRDETCDDQEGETITSDRDEPHDASKDYLECSTSGEPEHFIPSHELPRLESPEVVVVGETADTTPSGGWSIQEYLGFGVIPEDSTAPPPPQLPLQPYPPSFWDEYRDDVIWDVEHDYTESAPLAHEPQYDERLEESSTPLVVPTEPTCRATPHFDDEDDAPWSDDGSSCGTLAATTPAEGITLPTDYWSCWNRH